MGIFMVVLVWCTRCELKGLIAFQTPLNWWGKDPKQMINEKHTNNV
jgi:hypothetical protein